MKKRSLTITVLSNMTSNYSEGLGNIASVQKIYKNQKVYSIRSRESLKNSIMVQAKMYDDLQVAVDGATQKKVTEQLNASNCRGLEGGYMSTKGTTYIRNSSIYLTDAISCESFVNETRFHNNLYLASTYAKDKNLNVQGNAKDTGLMPYQYEYDKSLKVYSLTIDLNKIGVDDNFNMSAENSEKIERVNLILDAVENLSLVVKGNLDNSEPLFIVGGLSEYKTHYFENVVSVSQNKLSLPEDLKIKLDKGFSCGLLKGNILDNESEIIEKLNPKTITKFFDDLKEEVKEYYK